MIIPDINLLVYAYDESSPFHKKAKSWLSACLDGRQEVGFPLVSILGFIRVASNPRIFENPFPSTTACRITESWLATPQAALLSPSNRHWQVMQELIDDSHVSSNCITDVHIAALAIEHQGIVHSNDSDFGRFEKVRWINPLLK